MQPREVLDRLKLHKLPPPYFDGLCPTSPCAEFPRSLCVGKLFQGCHPRRNLHTCLSECLQPAIIEGNQSALALDESNRLDFVRLNAAGVEPLCQIINRAK